MKTEKMKRRTRIIRKNGTKGSKLIKTSRLENREMKIN
jgi:hypothetical protein